MQKSNNLADKELKGADAALRRAAVNAKKLAEQQGTPYVVYKTTDTKLPTKKNSSSSE